VTPFDPFSGWVRVVRPIGPVDDPNIARRPGWNLQPQLCLGGSNMTRIATSRFT
jgi:hypothetical protein